MSQYRAYIDSAAAAGGMLIAAANVDFDIAWNLPFSIAYMGLAGGLAAAGSEAIITLSTYAKHPVKDFPKLVKLWSRTRGKTTRENIEQRLTRLEEARQSLLPHVYHQHRGHLFAEANMFESAFEEFENSLSYRQSFPAHKGPITWLSQEMNRRETEKRKDIPPEMKAMMIATAYQLSGYDKKADMQWQRALEEGKDNIELNILYARALDAMSLCAEAQWKKVYDIVSRKAEQGLIETEQIGDSSVFRLAESDILENVFVIKKSQDSEALAAEAGLTRLVHDKVTPWLEEQDLFESYAITRVLDVGADPGHLVSLYEHGELLVDHLRENKDPEMLVRAARFLAIIHSIMAEHALPALDRITHFDSRVVEISEKLSGQHIPSGMYKDALTRFMDAAHLPIKYSRDSPDVFNRDAHGKNWSVSKDGRITAIDFQPRAAVKPEDELSKLIETGRCLPNTPAADLERERIIRAYHEQAAAMGVIQLPPPEDLCFRKLNADLIRAVSFFCYSYGRHEQELRREYLTNAIHSANRIHDEQVDVMDNAERELYIEFRKGLEALLKIEQATSRARSSG